jgi:DNA repair exonuclease SbcCD ATPase subunit
MKTVFNGLVQAYASERNPLQTIIEFILTDFKPNKNKQRIPEAEAENIITSAKNMPIKVNYENDRIKGHNFSVPIGTLAEVWQDNDTIRARSILWKQEYPEVDTYLRTATAEGKEIGTSWEILYDETTQENGIEDLHNCIVRGATIVDNPAYGNRTRILSIAESQLDELEMMRQSFSELLYVIDTLYAEAMQREIEKTALENATSALDKLKEMVTAFQNARAEVENKEAEKVQLSDTISALTVRVEALETEKAEAETKQAEAEVANNRRKELESVGITLSDEDFNTRKEYYVAMAEETFSNYIRDLGSLSKKIVNVPDTLGNGQKSSAKEIAQALREVK